jgi:hypothetical protein
VLAIGMHRITKVLAIGMHRMHTAMKCEQNKI